MSAERFRFGEFELDGSAFELRRARRTVHLERIPFELLWFLVERSGQMVPRGEIVERIWGKDVYLDAESAVSTAVRKVRRALHDDPEEPRFVLTVPGKGYRFVASVEKMEPHLAAVQAVADKHETSAVGAASRGPEHWKILIPAIAVLTALAAMAFFHFHRVQALTEKDTIVLLDFVNSTGNAVFDDTLKQALSVQLSQSPFLNILSDKKMSETLQMMGHPTAEPTDQKTAREICQRTQSAVMLTSSIATLGGQYVIGINAEDCSTGDYLVREQVVAGSKEEVLKSVDQAGAKLREKLGESLGSIRKFNTPIEEATTPSLEALQAYSLGRRLDAKGDFTGAVPLFQRAIRLDAKFAMAYASLSAMYANLGENVLSAKNIQKAYELRERVTDREKFYIETEYYDTVTGELEKSLQVCKLWEQTYPQDFVPHFTAGNIDDLLGRYKEGLAEARESLRMDPENDLNNAYLVYSYLTVNQLEEARITAQHILAKNPDSLPLHITLYPLAFVRNDSEAMAREVAWAATKPGVEDVMIADEASTAAYHGQLTEARELSRRAIASAELAGENETAAGYEADAALREALFGNAGRVEKWSAPALAGSEDRIVQFVAVLALAIGGDTAHAQALAAGLRRRFPQDTITKFDYLPTIYGQLALSRNNSSRAIEALQVAAPYELGQAGGGGFGVALYPVYLRGEAYLAAGRGGEATVEFEKILDHRSIVIFEAIGALAHLGLARACALQGDSARARSAYRDFFTLWKDADPDIPIYKAERAEYAKLQ
ncbi:MAG: winged helix-turn-helix domain-containing protein [Terriglobales bacterium]